MLYKTITLELIQELPALYGRSASNRTLLAKVEASALELKARHEAWKERLAQANPGRDPSQVAERGDGTGDRGAEGRLPCESAGGRGRPLCRSTRR